MKRLVIALFLLACLALPAFAQGNAAGEWDVTLNTPGGARNFKVVFKVEGEKLTGEMKRQDGNLPVQGKVKGKEISFSYTVNYNGNALPITMSGTLEGDAMSGTADFGGAAQDSWSAKRAGAAAAASQAAPAAAASSASAAGNEWEITIVSPMGPNTSMLVYTVAGENVNGQIKNQQGALPIAGTLKGGDIQLKFTVKFQDNDLPITLKGKVEGEAMKGVADFGGLAEGEWSAKRKAGAASSSSSGSSSNAATASSAGNISGTWNFEVETSQGAGAPTFIFKQEGEKLTGSYKGQLGEAPLTGTVQGNKIEFSFKLSGQIEGTVTYTGTIEGNTMKGTAKYAELGEATWKAKKQ